MNMIGSCASVLSHQYQYAGIAVYLRAGGARDTASLVDAISVVNVRTAYWHLRHLTLAGLNGAAGPVAAPACRFAGPHAALLRLHDLLEADLLSTEQLLGPSAFGGHDQHHALTLHVEVLRRTHRLVADLVDGTDCGTEHEELEARARHLAILLEAACDRSGARRDAPAALVTRPRQPVVVQRPRKHLGRPRMAG